MLIGEYTHAQDEKNRISLPIKFRKEIGKTIVVTHGLDNCLFIYSHKEWAKIAEKLGNLSIGQADTRSFSRFILGGASEVDGLPDLGVQLAGHLVEPDLVGVADGVRLRTEFADLAGEPTVVGGAGADIFS